MGSNKSPSQQRYRQQRAVWLQEAHKVALPGSLQTVMADPEQRAQLGRRAAVWVQVYRDMHGCGPTWRELASAIHPECEQQCGQSTEIPETFVRQKHSARIVTGLKQEGWLSATREERSLRPGERANVPRVRDAAAKIVKRQNQAA